MTTFPALEPTGRSIDLGDYPVKTFTSQSGKEVRILYGDKRTNIKMQLTFDNITDAEADGFVLHYDYVKGSFYTFLLSGSEWRAGWDGIQSRIELPAGNRWRYESAPQIQQVRPGISTVTVNLVGVL